MSHLIIDTNVPLKAANFHPVDEVDRKCSQACLSFIKKLMSSDEIIVLDTGQEVLSEYRRKIDTHSEGNAASQFLKWIMRKIALGKNVVQYQITPTGNNNYAEFPISPEFEKFDRSDRKFVALAKADPNNPCIYNGSDTDWWNFRKALEVNGVHIVFLCEEYMIAKSKGR